MVKLVLGEIAPTEHDAPIKWRIDAMHVVGDGIRIPVDSIAGTSTPGFRRRARHARFSRDPHPVL
jgi:hypothetical protein